MTNRHARALLLGTAAACAILTAPVFAAEQPTQVQHFNIPSQDAAMALNEYARQAGVQIVFPYDQVRGRQTPQVQGDLTRNDALALLTGDLGLTVTSDRAGMITLKDAADPQGGSAAGDGAEVEALIVTAQKKEEAIQDVPIAISAFTATALEEQKIEGGFDLLKAIPNVTFSKNNFTSYNFSIRGIGTKAISATTDPGVAVSFNNIALIQNRLFEQEYFDVERVEVLRGPQGTLYGRNATAGVINVISAKPDMNDFDGWIKGEVGNYHTKRVSAMVNVPLVEDKLAIRFAGSLTDRQGYDYNSVTKNAVNGRDLWSGRVTIGFNPTDNIRSNLIWERFNEDDNRSRTGKQLCHRDPGPDMIGGLPVVDPDWLPEQQAYYRSLFSQGCKPGSMYEDSAFGTPNGLALPFVFASNWLSSTSPDGSSVGLFPLGYDPSYPPHSILAGRGILQFGKDPYGGMMQSRDLRVIASLRDPVYRARADVIELNVDIDLTDGLTLSSQTAYDKDSVYSFQDFNRFNTVPIFQDTAGLVVYEGDTKVPSPWAGLAPGGVFCDPQIGCSNTMVGMDISQGSSKQFSQEVRLQSDFDGPLNFSAGANYTTFDVLIDYYVMYNLITTIAMTQPFNLGTDITQCITSGFLLEGPPVPAGDPAATCPYIDPNPVESINGEGHNYFRSKNPYKLKSSAAFGEAYYEIAPALKLTAGLRYTDDRKTFVPIPSQILLAPGLGAGGVVSRGYPEEEPIKQHWGEWTGRLGLDWKPDLSFTDQSMIYAFYSRGYKGGGANPPSPGFANLEEIAAQAMAVGWDQGTIDFYTQLGLFPILQLTGVEYGRTFKPEFVNAFEVGAKNTLLSGALTFNTGAFYYDYKDYQVSQIRDRTAVNENFDATIWGLEFQTIFAPSRNFQLIANLGYLDTRIGDGMKSIDIMDRTQSNPNYVLVKPWAQLPSNCVVPLHVVQDFLDQDSRPSIYGLCSGVGGIIGLQSVGYPVIDSATGARYNPLATDDDGDLIYPELNGGAGLYADLGGNELPNSPHWTANIGAQYGFDVLEGWRATVRGDAYWQSQSWARVYNSDPYDKLHGWYNVNLSVWLENDDGLKIELYAKNLLDKTPITDSFLNSDDTALTTNVFVLDPRLIGLSIRKEF